MKPAKLNLPVFVRVFGPFQDRYSKKFYNSQTLFEPTTWKTVNRRLTHRLIEDAINEKETIGWYSTYSTRVIGFDIDSHQTNEEYKLNPTLKSKYAKIIDIMQGELPSLVFQSPRGLHCYYLLNQLLPFSIMQMVLTDKISKISSVELLPTPKHSLRIPSKKRQLNPENLTPIAYDIENIVYYNPVYLFLYSHIPKILRERFSKGDHLTRTLYEEQRINKVERSFLPINPGQSNDKFLRLSALYFYAKLTVPQATQRFLALLKVSNYKGDLKNIKRLEERIESNYRSLSKKKYFFIEENANLELFDEIIIDNIIARSPFAKQRESKLRVFLIRLFNYINYHQSVKKDHNTYLLYSYIYFPFYRKFRDEETFPLPSIMMYNWNSRYHEIIKFLVEIKILELKYDYFYNEENQELNRCRYYKINKMAEIKRDGDNRVAALSALVQEKNENKHSITDICNYLNISPRTLKRWLSGKSSIKPSMHKAIDNLLTTLKSQ